MQRIIYSKSYIDSQVLKYGIVWSQIAEDEIFFQLGDNYGTIKMTDENDFILYFISPKLGAQHVRAANLEFALEGIINALTFNQERKKSRECRTKQI